MRKTPNFRFFLLSVLAAPKRRFFEDYLCVGLLVLALAISRFEIASTTLDMKQERKIGRSYAAMASLMMRTKKAPEGAI